jgi:hypothetical protein
MFTKQVSRPVGSLDPQIVAPRPSRSNNSRKDLFTGRFEVFVPFRSEVDRAADVRGWLSRVRTGTPPKQRLLASTGDHLGHQATSQPVAALSCMTAATDWPRIGPATHCAMTQEDEWRREANPQVDDHLMASPQPAESPSRTLSRWRHGFKSRWDYADQRPMFSSLEGQWPRIGPAAYTGPSRLSCSGSNADEPLIISAVAGRTTVQRDIS